MNAERTSGVVVLAASDVELAGAQRALSLRARGEGEYIGVVNGREVTAVVTGIGRVRAEGAVVKVLERYRPGLLVVIGFAGGLDPALRVGELLRVRYVVDEGGGVFDLGAEMPRRIERLPEHVDRRGCVVTVSRVAGSVERKRALLSAYGCGAVDMESAAVASEAARGGVRLVVLRAISDGAETELPAESVGWVSGVGRSRLLPVIGYLLRRPWAVPGLVRLGRSAHLASRRLGDGLRELLLSHAE